MNIRRNTVLIIFASCIFLHVIAHHTCANMSSGRVIIIPPNEIYLSGFESLNELCRTCSSKKLQNNNEKKNCNKVCENVQKYRNYSNANILHRLYSDLGKLVFENMVEGITVFNRQCNTTQKNFRYLLNTKDKNPIASCISNGNILYFYNKVKSNDKKMRVLLLKKKSDAFVWIEYPDNFKEAIQTCIHSSTIKNTELEVQLVLFDGLKKETKSIRLKFLKNYQTFSIKSIMELKYAVASLLFENKFPKPIPVKEEKEDKPSNKE